MTPGKEAMKYQYTIYEFVETIDFFGSKIGGTEWVPALYEDEGEIESLEDIKRYLRHMQEKKPDRPFKIMKRQVTEWEDF